MRLDTMMSVTPTRNVIAFSNKGHTARTATCFDRLSPPSLPARIGVRFVESDSDMAEAYSSAKG